MNIYKEFASDALVEKFSDLGAFLKAVNVSNEAVGLVDSLTGENRLRKKQLVGTAIELYGEKEILRVALFRNWLYSQDMEDLMHCAKRTGTVVPKMKGHKNKRSYICKKIMSRWFNRGVQDVADGVLKGYNDAYKNFRSNFDEWTPEQVEKSIYSYSDEYLDYLSPISESREELVKSLKRMDLYIIARATGHDEDANYIASLFNDLDSFFYEKHFLESLAYYLFAEEKRRYSNLQVQNAVLKHTLKTSVQQANMQLEDAMKLLEEKDKEIQNLLIENETLKQRIENYKKVLNRGMLESELFENQQVLVIGHPVQRDMYEEEITVRGGIFEFIPAVADEAGFSALEGAVSRADIILYIRTYTSHSVSNFIKSKINLDKLHTITCNGRDTFVSEIRRVFKNKLNGKQDGETTEVGVS